MLRARRPLTLHVSALSDAEYATYTESLSELANLEVSSGKDIEWEKVILSVRETRGWIRGRYGTCVDGAVIDQILKNFAPDLGPQDVLTGGQFFAVMRLISHVQSGATVDDSLVFVQANTESFPLPQDSKRPSTRSDVVLSRRSSTKSSPPPAPPPRPSLENQSAATTPTIPALPPRTTAPNTSPNPFKTTHPLSHSQSPRSLTEPSSTPTSSNPFRISLQKPAPPPSVSSTSSSSSSSPPKHATPPLPPRKPALLPPPPRHASLVRVPLARSKASSAYIPPLPPPSASPKPPKATSLLIKQSLEAAKGAQSVKDVMDSLGKERRAEVIRKSGSSAGNSTNGNGAKMVSTDTAMDVSPPRSFYDVAAARIGTGSPSSSSASSTNEPSVTSPPAVMIQPASPLRITRSTFSDHQSVHPSTVPFANPRRSKSLHHPSPGSTVGAVPLSDDGSPAFSRAYSHTHTHSLSQSQSNSPPTYTPPLPPPRRRRPESIQTTCSPFADIVTVDRDRDQDSVEQWKSGKPLRHSFNELDAKSRTRPGPVSGSGSGPSMMDTLQRTLATLRPGDGFESVRARAEGRVLPGGYSKMGRGGERLVGEEDDDEEEEGDDVDVDQNSDTSLDTKAKEALIGAI